MLTNTRVNVQRVSLGLTRKDGLHLLQHGGTWGHGAQGNRRTEEANTV